MTTFLLASLRAELVAAADPTRAAGMKAYMKSTMPFHGVPAPARRALQKRIFAAHPIASEEAWRRDVLSLWRQAKYREERYAAIELSGDKRAAAFQTLDSLPMYEEMIVTGAWWDYVDDLAAHRLGGLLRAFPDAMKRTMRSWSHTGDLWKRRSAILCQTTFKADTDLELLYDVIEPAIAAPEIFLRKAIGWALRQYAWTDSREIIRYVDAKKTALSPLSKREALKNVLRSELGGGVVP